jgi:hypothetical protein
MIRFSHEANSWQFKTAYNSTAFYSNEGWMNVSVEDARYFVDRGAYIQLIFHS